MRTVRETGMAGEGAVAVERCSCGAIHVGVGATTLWQEWQQIDQDLVSQVHDAGGAVIAWTVNEIGDLDRMVRLGVDGLCGNYPDRIRVAIAPRLDQASRA